MFALIKPASNFIIIAILVGHNLKKYYWANSYSSNEVSN